MSLNIEKKHIIPYQNILNADALSFLEKIVDQFSEERMVLLEKRRHTQQEINKNARIDFLSATASLRADKSWKVAPPPADLEDRRVEITGPVDRKMIINGLNSGAKVYMADFEDSQSPTWDGIMNGQVNLLDAIRRTVTFTNPQGKVYQLKPDQDLAVLIVRPRGLHLEEKHITHNGKAVPAAFVDFALYFFHNAREALKRGSGPYFYLPKIEHHEEARLWAKIFATAEELLGIPKGSIAATVLIETITAVFEMHEILYELRDYCVGLNCGRWDYIFSFIKKLAADKKYTLPNREQVGMGVPFLRSYSQLLIQTCHQRGAHAMGGMAAQIPIKHDPLANEKALAKVRIDKEREAKTGHDGTWVAHPGLIPLAMEIFSKYVPHQHQKDKLLSELTITAEALLQVPTGSITWDGITGNARAAVHYLAAWLSGTGCVPINHLMEDMATAEIARAQLWQWLHHGSLKTDDGQEITPSLIEKAFSSIADELKEPDSFKVASPPYYEKAFSLLRKIVLAKDFSEFLTLASMDHLKSV